MLGVAPVQQSEKHLIGRYLLVGGFNTLFGFSTFALLTWLLTPVVPFAYVVASLLSSAVNVTVSFLNHRFFVFQSDGNLLQEWLRSLVVYGSSTAISALLLPPLVWLLTLVTGNSRWAPYAAGACVIGLSVAWNFLGHKHYAFAPSAVETPESGGTPRGRAS